MKYMQCPLCNYVLYDLAHFLIHTRVIHHRISEIKQEKEDEILLFMQPEPYKFRGPLNHDT